MANFVFDGIDHYIESLEKIGGKGATGVIKYAVYPGAGIFADAVKAEILAHHSDSGDMAESMGLSTMRNENGFINTRLNFAGYDSKGTPNALKAAVLESGTSKKKGTHFLSKTVKRVQASVEKAMEAAFDEKIKQIMGG